MFAPALTGPRVCICTSITWTTQLKHSHALALIQSHARAHTHTHRERERETDRQTHTHTHTGNGLKLATGACKALAATLDGDGASPGARQTAAAAHVGAGRGLPPPWPSLLSCGWQREHPRNGNREGSESEDETDEEGGGVGGYVDCCPFLVLAVVCVPVCYSGRACLRLHDVIFTLQRLCVICQHARLAKQTGASQQCRVPPLHGSGSPSAENGATCCRIS